MPEGKQDKAYYHRWILINFPNKGTTGTHNHNHDHDWTTGTGTTGSGSGSNLSLGGSFGKITGLPTT